MNAPALSWDAVVNITKVELELISVPEMYLFLEKGMRDGVSYIYERYSKADNKYLKSHDPKLESKHIIYLDANNLYGYAMSKFLPKSGFKWIDPKNLIQINTTAINENADFEKIDLAYPKELHELHFDYALASNKIEIKKETLSIYQLKIAEFYIPIGTVKKLMSKNFGEEKYLLHYGNLPVYLRLGLKLNKTHCVLRFN